MSRWRTLAAILTVLLPVAGRGVASAQEVQVYSEFRRIGADGEVVEADRGGRVREILSPAIPRNGFASFRLVLKGPAGKPFHMYLGENPENLLKVTLYRESATQGVPDALQKVEDFPVSGVMPDGPLTYLIDIWTPATTAVRRIRLEAQLHMEGNWVIYPMELRVHGATIPANPIVTGAVLPVTAPAAETALTAWDPVLCRQPHRAADAGLTVRGLIRRNASQDIALEKKLEERFGKDRVRSGLAKALGRPDVAAWCTDRKLEHPEAYLGVRDFLYKVALEAQ